jgi:heat shock transcription factor
MLTHYENANGHSPLTDEERANMLNMIASSSASGTNNALVSPTPPPPPSLDDLGLTQQEIDNLMALQTEQDNKIESVKHTLQPLSPSGELPGILDANNYYSTDMHDLDLNAASLDLDQYLDPGAFYTGSSPVTGGGEFNGFDGFGAGDGNVTMSDGLDFGLDGTNDGVRITEEESEVNTPDNAGAEGYEGNSPSKKRRKN